MDLTLLKNKTILMIDDNKDLFEIYEDFFERHDVKFLWAGDGEQGLESFKNNSQIIDLIVMDIIMPKMNGIQAIEEIRKLNREVKILICTGVDIFGEELVRLRADDNLSIIEKPFQEKDFLSEIIRLIS